MPLCVLRTNLAKTAFKANFHPTFTKLVADLLEKPIEKITLVVEAGSDMSRGGGLDPTLWLSIESINVFSAEKNPKIGQGLRKMLSDTLSLPEDRIVVTLRELPKVDLA